MIPGQYLTPALVHRNVAQGLGVYDRASPPYHAGSDTAANRRTLIIPAMRISIGGLGHYIGDETELDLNEASTWDSLTTDYTVPVTRAGKSFFIYACRPASGRVPVFKISAASGYPTGYSASTSKKMGGFDCLPYVTAPTWLADTVTALNYVIQPTTPGATKLLYKCTARSGDYKTHATTEPTWPTTVGATVVDDAITWTCVANACQNLDANHPYKNHEMGSILFNSIWDLVDRPGCDLRQGMVKMSLTPWDGVKNRWIDIYLASGTGNSCTSVFGATIKDTVSWDTFVEYGRLQGKRLLRDAEFQIAATGGNEQTNIAGSADPGTVTFPLDSTGMSMISFCGVIGACGAMYQWLDEQSYRFDGATNHTHSITVTGEAQTVTSGNPSVDVAPAWTWQDMSGKGSRNKQGTYGDVKLLAGGTWYSAAACGSRCRILSLWPWHANSYTGGRFCAEPA